MTEMVIQQFPKGALWGAAAMIGIALITVTAVRTGLVDAGPSAPAARARDHVAIVATRSFQFVDEPNGALVATDISTGEVAETIAPGANSGFIRGVLRGLARERKLHQASHAPPFTVTQWADGALTLTDTATGRIIELGSFGPDNRAVWTRLLKAHGETLLPPVKPQ